MAVRDTAIPRPGPHGGEIPVRVYRPERAETPGPCVVYLHGGAFVKGSLDSGDTVAWGVAEESGVVVVSVDYRLAPKHPFPAAVEDCYAVTSHLSNRKDVRDTGRPARAVGRQCGWQPGSGDLSHGA